MGNDKNFVMPTSHRDEVDGEFDKFLIINNSVIILTIKVKNNKHFPVIIKRKFIEDEWKKF